MSAEKKQKLLENIDEEIGKTSDEETANILRGWREKASEIPNDNPELSWRIDRIAQMCFRALNIDLREGMTLWQEERYSAYFEGARGILQNSMCNGAINASAHEELEKHYRSFKVIISDAPILNTSLLGRAERLMTELSSVCDMWNESSLPKPATDAERTLMLNILLLCADVLNERVTIDGMQKRAEAIYKVAESQWASRFLVNKVSNFFEGLLDTVLVL